jgi:hypothetical protein
MMMMAQKVATKHMLSTPLYKKFNPENRDPESALLLPFMDRLNALNQQYKIKREDGID